MLLASSNCLGRMTAEAIGAGHWRIAGAKSTAALGGTNQPRRRIPSNGRKSQEYAAMFRWALIFAVIALVAAVLGFGGIAGAAAGVAKILFILGLGLVLLFVVLGVMGAKKVT